MALNEDAVLLNELAQGLRPVPEGIAWYENLDEQRKRDVLRFLAGCITQAGARPEDVMTAVQASGTKATATPAVLLDKPQLPVQMAKVAGLPEPELLRAFPLFVALLGVADERRRRTACRVRCGHWWHNLGTSLGEG